MTSELAETFAAQMHALLGHAPARLGLAVSGGGDSVALMALAQGWAKDTQLHVATVDHGLRPEAAQEARAVGETARALGLGHDILHWHGWDGRGNLQDAARQGRRAALAAWAQSRGIDTVLLGHTRDDQAETVLMRLARGSGVDGLAAMAALHQSHGVRWVRPLIDQSRDSLRAYLTQRALPWSEDPSNDDPRFDRVKARQILAALAPLGLTPDRLVATAAHMSHARDVLDRAADTARHALMQRDSGDITFARPAFDNLPQDTQYRLLADALCEVASAPYRPRLKALHRALSQSRMCCHGCLITRSPKALRISREYNAVRACKAQIGQVWDRRWQLIAPTGFAPQNHHIGALGPQGLAQCKHPRALPYASLIASPAIWQDTQLVAAPLAGFGQGWQAICGAPPAGIPIRALNLRP